MPVKWTTFKPCYTQHVKEQRYTVCKPVCQEYQVPVKCDLPHRQRAYRPGVRSEPRYPRRRERRASGDRGGEGGLAYRAAPESYLPRLQSRDAPILILALTSKTLTTGQIYDAASTVIQQKLLQLEGVGDVSLGGISLPAVRIDLNPQALFKYGIGLEDVRAAISAANANSPKGAVDDSARRYQVYVNDTATTPEQYRTLIIAYRDGAPVRLGDIAQITNGVEDVRNLGLADGPNRAVLMIIRKQPGANVIDTVNSIKAVLPEIQASVPAGINIILTNDRTASIRASVNDVETTLLIALALVVTVVVVMLRNPRAAIVPAIVVPLSLVGTFAVMYGLGFSLNNLSLMALTVATGFVVDDAIVVIENISRHVEAGASRMQATLDGAAEVGFTVLSMSCSLIAVFIPILLMGGLVGRELREFATTLAVTVVLSLIVSLTTTPMLCGQVLRRPPRLGPVLSTFERGFEWLRGFYGRTLTDAIRHPRAVMLILLGVVVLNFYLFAKVPKGFFPEESSGSLFGNVVADQSISFQAMQQKMMQIVSIVSRDPAVAHVVAFTGGGGGPGGGTTNTGGLFTALKPLNVRKLTDAAVIARLRRELSGVTGARLFLQSAQDIHFGGRQGNAAYQYTLLSDDLATLDAWTPKITTALQNNPALQDVSSDRQAAGLDVQLQIDRATAARLGVNMSDVDNTLYDAFGQRLVSTIYEDMNQYYVVMEVAPQFWQSPETLKDIWVSTQGGALGGTQSTAPGAGSFGSGATASSTSGSSSAASTRSSCNSSSTGSSSTGSALRAPARQRTMPRGTTPKISSPTVPARPPRAQRSARASKPWCLSRRSAPTVRESRRSPSVIRGPSWQRRSPSTCPRASRSAARSRRSTARCKSCMCRSPSRARSPAPPRSSSRPSPRSRCSCWPR